MMSHKIVPKFFSDMMLESVNNLIEVNEEQLSKYADMLLWWNEKVNLLSRNSDKKSVEKHIVHSLFLGVVGSFAREKAFVDIGSGGGLPGIPLAICFPEKQFELLDRTARKCAAMNDMIGQLGLKNAAAHQTDAGMFHVKHASFGWTSKHAIKLSEFATLSEKYPHAKAYFLKGEDYKEELRDVSLPLKVLEFKIDDYLEDPFYDGKRVLILEQLQAGDQS
ncbi:MAG: class I SAM-dependent methyltransferase [Candidatus Cyclonatronum sp.]|uniref:16S rRNA (guanine(527)-N(7))-methyltransferase RsmG n=1 Tax=Cyclonatronum sp. TaxID=3024185 RepID=UPI0025C6CF16|nr:RsmG family class I SAM-dependent methyltransferase [Cyclonatronum sp.]MCH8488008.1 class I SAM-dependent methyltransferase [Cyclonatronum sp.]